MDYNQFMKLMEPGESAGKDTISALQEYVNEFPYFQSAQTLLAKSMHLQQHVRYERQLKIAAAYAADRKILFEIIHPKNTGSVTEQPSAEDSPFNLNSANDFIETNNPFADTDSVSISPSIDTEVLPETTISSTPEPISAPVYYNEESDIIEDIPDDYDEPTGTDPHEIIRRRLIEILGLKEEVKEPVKEEPPLEKTLAVASDVLQSPENKKPEEKSTERSDENIPNKPQPEAPKKDIIEQLAEESTRAIDFIDKSELEYALEASIIQSLEKLPVIEKKEENEKTIREIPANKERSFNDWLGKVQIAGFGKFEEVHAEDLTGNQIQQELQINIKEQKPDDSFKEEQKQGIRDELIERFIKTDPKIVPSKSEFYSPANQAKKSITENEDLVSETLAKIYRQQGNFLKAHSSYQKLSLLYPEKKAYFAALISEIDKEINNLDKKDL